MAPQPFEALREKLSAYIQAVHQGKSISNADCQTTYQLVYQMCTARNSPHTQPLYDFYSQLVFDGFLTDSLMPIISSKQSDEEFLHAFVDGWSTHVQMVKLISTVFRYLDKFHVPRSGLRETKEVGIRKFRQLVFDPLCERLTACLLGRVASDREGVFVDRTVIKQAVNVIVRLSDWRQVFSNTTPSENLSSMEEDQSLISEFQIGIYTQTFESKLVAATAEYYKAKSNSWISSLSCGEFLHQVQETIDSETKRVEDFLHPCTKTKILKVIEENTIGFHLSSLLDNPESGMQIMLQESRLDELGLLYKLCKGHNASASEPSSMLKEVSVRMRNYVTMKGDELVAQWADSKDIKGFIPQLIIMQRTVDKLIRVPMKADPLMIKVMKDAFEQFTNKDVGTHSVADLLARYLDECLKTGGEKKAGDMGDLIGSAVTLFSFLTDKDLFAESYRKLLALRLLNGSSSEENESELLFIRKMKDCCGTGYTSKFEGMIKDMGKFKSLQAQYEAHLKENEDERKLPIKSFSVKVLTTGYWPQYQTDEIILPSSMTSCLESFKSFYTSSVKQNCVLRWVHNLGTVHIEATFPGKVGKKEFIMSTLQALVLMLFNEQQSMTIAQVKEATKIPPPVVVRIVEIFVRKFKLLAYEKPGEKPGADTVVMVNPAFKTNKYRTNMTTQLSKTADEERASTKATVQIDRKFAIDACIVRIMKSRKQLEHSSLVGQTMQQLLSHFKPDPKIIKTRIEDLIVREFLERDENDPRLYKYVA